MRELLSELIRVRLPAPVVDCFSTIETDGVLLPIELPMREVLPELRRLSELAAGRFATVGAEDFFVLIELPIRKLDLACDELELAVGWFPKIETDGVLLSIELPICEVLPVLMRLSELAAGCFATVGAEGFFVLIELPIRKLDLACDELELAVGWFPKIETDGVLLPIELPIREVLPVLMRLSELAAPALPVLAMSDLVTVGADDFSVVIELPIRKLEPVVSRLFDVETEGVLSLIELPIRDVILELMRVLELALKEPVIVCLPLLEFAPTDLLMLEELEKDVPGLKSDWLGVVRDRDVITRLDVTLLGLRLVTILLDRDATGVLVVNVLVELLRLGSLEVLDLV